jgi:putative glutamine amidotransferase
MKRPRIGVNGKLVVEGNESFFKLDRNYLRSVERAGGLPVLMPFFSTSADAAAFLSELDGVLLTGGPDVDSRRWKEPLHPKADPMHPARERSDFLVLEEVLERDLPALCICCAHQELNVALGGTLDQHVYDRPEVGRHSDGQVHDVALAVGSRTRTLLGGSRRRVNSYHHQAVRDPGRGLRVSALSPDGLVEGIEDPKRRFLIGVQWHPERMQDDRRQQGLFRALVREATRS